MQHPIDFIRSQKATHGTQRFNLLREYLQVMVLQMLYAQKGSEHLRFGGGTCLRICYDLPRYSEDLDFSLDNKDVKTGELMEALNAGFKASGVDFDLGIPQNIDEKRVAKYWLKFPNLLNQLALSPLKSEKLAIKLEVDLFPPKKGNVEHFYVTKFQQYFPIFKNDLPTLFSGKLCAIFQRPYPAMRDFYDLLWYLNKGIEPNYAELEEMKISAHDRGSLVKVFGKAVENIKGKDIIATLRDMIMNPEELSILENYPEAFAKAAERYLS